MSVLFTYSCQKPDYQIVVTIMDDMSADISRVSTLPGNNITLTYCVDTDGKALQMKAKSNESDIHSDKLVNGAPATKVPDYNYHMKFDDHAAGLWAEKCYEIALQSYKPYAYKLSKEAASNIQAEPAPSEAEPELEQPPEIANWEKRPQFSGSLFLKEHAPKRSFLSALFGLGSNTSRFL